MITLQYLKQIEPGAIFAKGVAPNNPDGLYMIEAHFNRPLLWIAKKGHGYDDWCIYVHWEDNGIDFVKTNGDKVRDKKNILKLVPCTDEVLDLYRH